jgi:hypothetical protein
MNRPLLVTACAVAALLPSAARAQHAMRPGMRMDMPQAKPKAKPANTPPVSRKAPRASPAKAKAQSHSVDPHAGHQMPMDTATGPRPAPGPQERSTSTPPPPSIPPSPAKAGAQSRRLDPHAQHTMPMDATTGPRPAPGKQEEEVIAPPADAMEGMAMPSAPATPHDPHAGHDMAGMSMLPFDGAYGEGSGTARNPGNAGQMLGEHLMLGDWGVMLHGYVWGTYTDQGGPRGANMAFVESMAMLSGTRDLGGGTRLQLRTMMSLEPLIGKSGYPNLFATGETADGVNPLIDRQHPHDLFMELSARVDVDAGKGSAFLYGGPVAEPALGPSAFMHRASATYEPMAPITHHWFDSTHIAYGVVTAGYAAPRWQIEASAFRGREPDQYRWAIERPSLDSWSVRATWTPSPAWALQASHGQLKSPEQLEAFRNERRTTASVQYAHGGVATLLAYSAKHKVPGRVLSAWLAEVNWDINRHDTLFARGESVANDELFPDPASPLHDAKFRVGKLEGGYAYRLPLVGPFDLALGGAVGVYAKPKALDQAYGTFPVSVSLFAKVSLAR